MGVKNKTEEKRQTTIVSLKLVCVLGFVNMYTLLLPFRWKSSQHDRHKWVEECGLLHTDTGKNRFPSLASCKAVVILGQ